MDFKRLLTYCKRNDRRAQEELFYRYSGHALTVAVRYAGESAQCKDIVQESMIRVFRHLNSFRGKDESSFKAWLRKITAREAIRWMKSRQRDAKLKSSDIKWSFKSNEIENRLLKEELYRYLQSLPEGYRTVFNMYAIEGYSHREIGKILGISESSSRSQLSRARAQLQEMIKENHRHEQAIRS